MPKVGETGFVRARKLSPFVLTHGKNRLGFVGGGWYKWDKGDYAASVELEETIPRIIARLPPSDDRTPGLVRLDGLRVGEVSRHFEASTIGAINGWMEHRLGLEGWAAGARVGSSALGIGRLGLGGGSTVSLSLDMVTQDDLTSDGFVAVFDVVEAGIASDTVRVVVPGDGACGRMVAAWMRQLGTMVGRESWRDLALRGLADAVGTAIGTEASYVSDRLTAYFRSEPTESSPVTVLGVPLKRQVCLGAAICLSPSTEWLQLFPAATLGEIERCVAEVSQRHAVPLGYLP
jgi:hypothetical protein